MSCFRIERLPDAKRTALRFAICFVPVLAFLVVTIVNGYPRSDRAAYDELVHLQQQMLAGIALAVSCGSIALFALWQREARNPLTDEGGLGWLSIHGWEGDVNRLPQRGLLSATEIVGVLIFTFAIEWLSPAAIVFVPICWSVVRSVPCWKRSSREQPFVFGAICLLFSTAILFSKNLWLALPAAISAILLVESQLLIALHLKAGEMIMSNISLGTKRSIFASPRPGPPPSAAADRVAPQLFPISQLETVVVSERPSWAISIWTATVFAWVMFCITSRTVEFGPLNNDTPIYVIIGHSGIFASFVVGLIRSWKQFAPHVWTPRLGIVSRLRLLRPVVWPWDRILLPHALNAAICLFAVALANIATPLGYAVLIFVEVLIVLRCGVTPDEWQMTSDARLSSKFLPVERADRRTA